MVRAAVRTWPAEPSYDALSWGKRGVSILYRIAPVNRHRARSTFNYSAFGGGSTVASFGHRDAAPRGAAQKQSIPRAVPAYLQ